MVMIALTDSPVSHVRYSGSVSILAFLSRRSRFWKAFILSVLGVFWFIFIARSSINNIAKDILRPWILESIFQLSYMQSSSSSTGRGHHPPFLCPESDCGKSFQRKEHLNRHARTHGPVRPHKCFICYRSFARR